MNKPLLVCGVIVAAGLALSTGCNLFDDDDSAFDSQTVVDGSGVITERSHSVAGFSGVTFASEGDVNIARTGSESLDVRADDNLHQYLLVSIWGGTLNMRTARGVDIRPTQSIEFEVNCNSLDRVTLSGVGDVDATNIDTGQFDALLSGVGDISVDGTATIQAVVLDGVGDYYARNLSSTEADVDLFGVGSVTVRVSDRLNVTISGEGDVFYIGDPIVTSNITGTGQVQKIN